MELRNLLFLGLALVHDATAFSAGSPPSVCLGHHAHHGDNHLQENECPYKMSFSTSTYTPSQEIQVTIKAADDRLFKGILIYAHRTVGDNERPVGNYTQFDEVKARFIDCLNQTNAGLTNNNNATIPSFVFTWQAPDENIGPILFKYMIVEEFETFWIDQRAPLLQPTETFVEPEPKYPAVVGSTDDIDWAGCGTTKGCFFYPGTCTGSDCKAAVTYRKASDNDDFLFEAFVNGSDYIAMGFSHDPFMKNDHVHACAAGNDQVAIQNGYNPSRHFMRNFKDGAMTEQAIKKENGQITCRFRRPASMLVYTRKWDDEVWDLNDDHFFFMVWGGLDYQSVRLYRHELPNARSDGRVDFNTYTVVGLNETQARSDPEPEVTDPPSTTPHHHHHHTTTDAASIERHSVILLVLAIMAMLILKT